MLNVIEVKNLSKLYIIERPFFKQMLAPFASRQRLCALNGISFDVKEGEILGVVGPNGAGKTTLLRIMADLLEPDAGYVKILGQTLKNNRRLREHIGYASSDERSFFWRLTGRENLEFFASLYGISNRQAKTHISELLEELNFGQESDRFFRDYSAGMRKKISVMRTILHKPSVLLLDEITNSLDPEAAEVVKLMVRNYVNKNNNIAAVWCTHRLEEINQICDRVIIIDSGKLKQDEPVNGPRKRYLSKQSMDYCLRIKNINGNFDNFCKRLGHKAGVSTYAGDNVKEIKLCDISEDEFGKIVSLAVKDLGAHIIFAGCVEKGGDTHPN